jgi:CMP-N-acetylneuraminic acid synthetase
MLDNWELFPNIKDNPYPFVIDWSEKELLDVDTEIDFKLVESYYG